MLHVFRCWDHVGLHQLFDRDRQVWYAPDHVYAGCVGVLSSLAYGRAG